jgi:hypothetical protein
MATIKNTKTTYVYEDVGKKEPSYTVWECKLVQPLWHTVWRLLKISKNKITI